MKMDAPAEVFSQPVPSVEDSKEIGIAFVKEYYTSAVHRRDGVTHMFGNDSIYVSNSGESYSGQAAIENAIRNLHLNEGKVRIFDVGTAPTGENGIMVHVVAAYIGETGEARFSESFYLTRQYMKKYYIRSTVFKWVDQPPALLIAEPPKHNTTVSLTPERKVEPKQPEVETPVVNEVNVEKTPEVVKEPEKSVPNTPKTNGNASGKQHNNAKGHRGQSPVWTNGGAGDGVAAHNENLPQREETKKTGPRNAFERTKNSPRSLYSIHISGITKKESGNLVEAAAEIKTFFSKFGEVTRVNIPSRILGPEYSTIFAFVDFAEKTAVEKIFAAEEGTHNRGRVSMNIEVPSFGYSGPIHISENRERHRNNNFYGSHRRGVSNNRRKDVKENGNKWKQPA